MFAFATPFVLNSKAPTLSRAVSSSTRWAIKKRATATMVLPQQFQDGSVLIIKQGPEEGQIGDCPFSQKANMALRARGIDFSVYLMNLGMKPDWYKTVNSSETTPTYVVGDKYHTSSDGIVELADEIGTKGTKLYDETNEHWDNAFDVIAPFFGNFVAYMKNKDPKEEEAIKDKLDASCDNINYHLKQVPGRFVVSDELTALDCNLAPKMHALLVAGRHFKGYTLPFHCSVIKTYMKSIYETDEWKATCCTDEVVIWGWSKFFPDAVPATQPVS